MGSYLGCLMVFFIPSGVMFPEVGACVCLADVCASVFSSAAAGGGWRSECPCVLAIQREFQVQVCFKFMRLLWFT